MHPQVVATPRGEDSQDGSSTGFVAAYDAGSSVGGASINTAQVISQALDPKKPLLSLQAILLDKDGIDKSLNEVDEMLMFLRVMKLKMKLKHVQKVSSEMISDRLILLM